MAMALQRSFDDLGTPLNQVTFVVVDVETTGGSPQTCSLTEVAAARYRGGELLGTYQTFVRPDGRIPPFITALTGISDAMVADAPRIGEMLPSFLEFVGGAVLVGHNLRFDLSFLDHALMSTGRERLDNPTVDTLALARRLVRDMVPDCKLGTLASTLRLPHQPSHRALNDVLATGDLLHDMLERAGSFGILGLEELLDLPRLIGHPQGAKLRLTTRLPHRPGVYWFADGAGGVLYVGKATDLQARVRSYFTGDRRNKVGRLLRQMQTVHHLVCAGPLSAAVMEGRLIRAWAPPFNQQGKPRRSATDVVSTETAARTVPAGVPGGTPSGGIPAVAPIGRRRRRHRQTWSPEELEVDPAVLLAPLAGQVAELSRQHRYEEAAAVRDDAERLRRLVTTHRRVEAVRRVGRLRLDIDGEGTVELDGGLLVTHTPTTGDGPALAISTRSDGHHDERVIVAHWLEANADKVRILAVGADPTPGHGPEMEPVSEPEQAEPVSEPVSEPEQAEPVSEPEQAEHPAVMGRAPRTAQASVRGLATPAVRIPSLGELCGALRPQSPVEDAVARPVAGPVP
ncbi:MAG: exonuclease domain-containing protein [Acidimicrobiales bacterium]